MPEEKRPPQVFISYSRRDFAFVEQLAADLEVAGLDREISPVLLKY